MSVDLSFTDRPEWIDARSKVWLPIGKHLSKDLNKRTVDAIKHIFFTGKLSSEKLSDDAIFLLISPKKPARLGLCS